MLQKVTVNGTSYVVDAATKAAAKAFGAKKLEVEVVPATAADIAEFTADGSEIEVVVGKTKSEPAQTPAV